jgi:adenine C2-methylase RlmN of 23S rRNA A2503 and tRNA A37
MDTQLLRYAACTGHGYGGRPSSPAAIEAFTAVLDRAGIPHTLRQRRGAAIEAGCGQLRNRRSQG